MTKLESRRCYVYGGVVDLRKGADGLRALVGKTQCEELYVFSNRTRALLEFLSVDKTGVWCGTVRLHHGSLEWPESPAVSNNSLVMNWHVYFLPVFPFTHSKT